MAQGSVKNTVLLGIVGALAFANWVLLSRTIDTSLPPVRKPTMTAVQNAPDLPEQLVVPLRSVTDFPETLARPIFFADRRMPEKPKPKPQVKPAPPPPPPVAATEVLPNLEPLVLIGIKMTGRDSDRQILVRTGAENQSVWLAVGDQFRGWTVRAVSNDEAVLEGRGQKSELKLYSSSAARTVRR